MHALGPVAVMFAGPTTIDVCAAVKPSPAVSLWLDMTVTTVSTLAGFVWLIALTVRHPIPLMARRWEITCYTAGAVVCLLGLLVYSPLFELLRTLMAMALVIRLARMRGDSRTPGERRRDGWFSRGWVLSACVMAAGLVVTFSAILEIPDWVGVAPTGATSQVGTFGDWVSVALAGPQEEMIAMAGVVTALEWAGHPVWLIYAVAIAVRISYHIHLGVPTALAVVPFAVASIWAFRRWRQVTPLAVMHTFYDAVLTVLPI